MSDSETSTQQPTEDQDDQTRLEKSPLPAGKEPLLPHRSAGTRLGEFCLLRPLGRGGMAEVWLAEQTTLRRNVALKLLRSELMTDDTYVQRFQTEAKAAAGLSHPNIVQVYTFGCEQGQHYIAQEYVDGQTLKSFLKRRGPLDVGVCLHIMRQVLSALAAAGERGIVHRDIKPENIMITRRGEAKVADFGLAQLQGGERLYLTQEGVTMGTPLYMSPEQVQGRPVDQRTDLYSFGITCYHMLAGRPPFVGDNPVAVAFKHVSEKPEPLAGIRPDVPKVVCEVISRLMAREPVDRYQDAQIALNDVKRIAKALKTGEDINVNETGLVTISGQMPRAGVWLPLLCVVSAVLAAGVGWYVRPRIPQPSVNVLSTTIPELPTAREQYLHAMLLVDNIDAFLAVENYHRNDRLWVNRAHEQLMLLYLKDYARYSAEAEQQRRLLERLGGEDQRLYTEAQLSEAALLAYSRKYADAQRKLKLIDRANLQKLSRSWQELEADLQRLISQQTQAS